MYSSLSFPCLTPIDRGLIPLLSRKATKPYPFIRAITAYAPSHLMCVLVTALKIFFSDGYISLCLPSS